MTEKLTVMEEGTPEWWAYRDYAGRGAHTQVVKDLRERGYTFNKPLQDLTMTFIKEVWRLGYLAGLSRGQEAMQLSPLAEGVDTPDAT